MLSTRTIAALALGSLVACAIAVPAAAHRNPASEIYRSAQSISYQLGSKRAVGYFLTHNGACQLTLMIAEAVDVDVAEPTNAAKLNVAILPGQSAALASEEGEAMLLTCGGNAETLMVKYAPQNNAAPQGTFAAQSDRVLK